MAIKIDPSRVAAARQAWEADIKANHPGFTDNNGRLRLAEPFDTDDQGNTTINEWERNRVREAQDSYDTVKTFDAKGNEREERVEAWKTVPLFYNRQARIQGDSILNSLNELREKSDNMQEIYKSVMDRIS